jgi:hypothetical protein
MMEQKRWMKSTLPSKRLSSKKKSLEMIVVSKKKAKKTLKAMSLKEQQERETSVTHVRHGSHGEQLLDDDD